MILTCPKCATRYLVDPVRLAPDGRQVRCARCSHDWWAELTPEAVSQMLADLPAKPSVADQPQAGTSEQEPPIASPPIDEPAQPQDQDQFQDRASAPETGPYPAEAAPDQPTPGQAVPERQASIEPPPVFPPAGDIESAPQSRAPRHQANLPALFEPKRRFGFLGIMVLVAIVLLIFNGLIIGQKYLSGLWSPLDQFYAAIGLVAPEVEPVALELQNVTTSRTSENGIPILVVTGEVRNPSDRRVGIPEITLTLRDSEGRALTSWSAKAVADAVGARGSVPFNTRLENPPEGVRNLEARIGGPDQFSTPSAPADVPAPPPAPETADQPAPATTSPGASGGEPGPAAPLDARSPPPAPAGH